MQKELIRECHIKWLKNNINLTFADIEQMTDEQSDTLCNELLGMECDALEADSDELELINEIQDIIFDEIPEYNDAEIAPAPKSHICPVCREFEFECKGSDDICEVCGWQDDILQELNPDEECGENQMSLNQAREAWKNGEKVE